MGCSTIKEAKIYNEALSKYTEATRQLINWTKSSIFFIKTPQNGQTRMPRILDCKIELFPATYHGLPLGPQLIDSFWNENFDRFNSKSAGWKGALLS